MNNKDSIITTNLKDITLNSQFLTLRTKDCDIEVDIKKLLKEPINSDSAYFNATEIAKCYSKRINDFVRLENTQEYINILEKKLNTISNGNKINLVKTVRGKHHGGTWLHSKLILKFLRWIDVNLEIEFDFFIQELILHSNELKIERENTKILYKDLSRVIDEVYIPAQESDNGKRFAYSNLAGLVNIKVLGSLAAKYAKENNIEIEKGKSVRDYLSKDMLKKIEEVERKIAGYIEFANITEYEALKNKIEQK